jgi:hypothetical protein
MSFLSGLGSFISSACSLVASAFSSVGSGISSFATRLIMPLPPQIQLAITAIIVIAEIVCEIAEILGLKPDKETAEELGAKAKDADLKRDDFESTEAYIDYLRNEVAFDREKFEKMSAEEQLACLAVGTSLYATNIEEKFGIGLSPDFLLKAGKLEMKALEVKAYMDAFKENGLADMKYMSDFLTGKLDEKTDNKVESAIISGLKAINPQISEKDIQTKIGDMTKAALKPEEY